MSKEETIDFLKSVVEMNMDHLLAGEFQHQMTFFTESCEGGPRVVLLPRFADQEDKERFMSTLPVIGAGMDDLTKIAFVHDAYVYVGSVNENDGRPVKHDGTPWGPGDMEYALTHNTPDAVNIREALHYLILTEEGFATASVVYNRTAEGLEFAWDNVMYATEQEVGTLQEGLFPDAMRAAWNAPKLLPTMRERFNIDFGLSEDKARLHVIAIAVKMAMNANQMPAMVPCYSREEAELLERSFKEGPLSGNALVLTGEEVEEIRDLDQAFNAPSFGES